MSTVSEQITTNRNYNTMAKAAQQQATGAGSSASIKSQDFLNLLTMQLQYQDPTNPMDNSQMLAQEAQFASLESMEQLTSSFTSFSSIYQANSLMGQKVEVKVDGATKTGTVDYVDFSDSKGASVNIGGTNYPLSSVTKVYGTSSSSTSDEDKNLFKNAISSIANNIGYLTQKAYQYFEKNSSGENTQTPDNSNSSNS